MSLTQRKKDQIVTLLCNEIPMLHSTCLILSLMGVQAERVMWISLFYQKMLSLHWHDGCSSRN
jgi:hypothetical protein